MKKMKVPAAPTTQPERFLDEDISELTTQAFLDYSVSVIVGRSLPDIRDGLKPVHRRIMQACIGLGARPNGHKFKCARITGDTVGCYHPYGDAATYEALIRMGQDFVHPVPMINKEGNFGSKANPSSFAAMRYTEAKLSPLANFMISDLSVKNTVDYRPNYDGKLTEPVLMPAEIPYFLLAPNVGIAVGFTTAAHPYNIAELVDGSIATILNPEISYDDLFRLVKGPDFPTGGITSAKVARQVLETGSGIMPVRSKYEIINDHTVVFTETPYLTPTDAIIDSIVEAVNGDPKRKPKPIPPSIPEISSIKDIKGQIWVCIKKGESLTAVINKLYKYTKLQTSLRCAYTGVHEGIPYEDINFKDAVLTWYDFRMETLRRKYTTLLEEVQRRLHLIAGLKLVLLDPEGAIKLIKNSKNRAEATDVLQKKYGLDEEQSLYVLEMKVYKFTKDDIAAQIQEENGLLDKAATYQRYLDHPAELTEQIITRLQEFKKAYPQQRCTELSYEMDKASTDDDRLLVREEQVTIFVSALGYIKAVNDDGQVSAQKRGGKGRQVGVKENDYIRTVLSVSSHDDLLFITDRGRAFRYPAHKIPQCEANQVGKHASMLVDLNQGEKVCDVAAVPSYTDEYFLVTLSRQGYIKATSMAEFANARQNGIIAVNILDNDTLVTATVVADTAAEYVYVAQENGKIVKFPAEQLPIVGRTTRGSKSCSDNSIPKVGMVITGEEDTHLVLISSAGLGKLTPTTDFPVHNRGTSGCIGIALKGSARLVGLSVCPDPVNSEIIAVSDKKLIRFSANSAPVFGRTAGGNRIMNLGTDEEVVSYGVITG